MKVEEYLAQLGQLTLDLWGRQTAHDLLLRTLYAHIAAGSPDPVARIEEIRRATIQSMAEAARLDDPAEAGVIERAETALDDFFDQVAARVKTEVEGNGRNHG